MQYTGQPIRVLTVDDHPLLREGIAAVLKRQADMQVVGEACNGLEALAQFRLLLPDITLMDLQMPEMDGVEAIAAIRNEYPQARILVLTTYKGDAQSWRALRAGALGYLLKSSLRTDLLAAIRAVHAGGRWIPAEIARELVNHAGEEPLTQREIEVLQRIAAGNSNREVGAMLSLSEETIKARMKSILAKLGAKDRTHAVSIALKRGLIQP
ncbi:response regulator transcription factor [Paucibacter sp. PLA-PC-4]|uniref:response regulator transcription factor n=1 Tax=Paucibacter sp. PLA-PC-4 TaxID=2993655 RepID=UPI0022495443|nr:response regulator transcription factor [Paucibacter sp. PLA-PC-4]MCX2861904.1 response regulator transcription factor [Paucibacter sp. PLA-PC-4]